MPKRKRSYPYARRSRRRLFKKRYSSSRIRKRRFTKAVKKLIQSSAEVKRIGIDPKSYAFTTMPSGNTAMSPAVDLMDFLLMQHGAADGSRVGESIRTKKATLKLIVTPGDATSILQVFIGYLRESPGTLPSSNSLSGIFDDGPVGAPADGTLVSLTRSINNDAFRVLHYKKIKISPSSAAIDVEVVNNNDFPAYRFMNIDLTKFMGVLKYTGEGVQYPNNRHLYMWCNWVNIKDITGTDHPTLKYYLDYQYTDI